MQKHNASLLDILRGSIIIPGELLSSRAHFRLMNSEAKLNRNLYIYNLSKIREGYACDGCETDATNCKPFTNLTQKILTFKLKCKTSSYRKHDVIGWWSRPGSL